MELIVRRSFTFAFIQSSSTLRHKKNKKKSSSRDLSQAKFLYFCAQNISFLPAAHTGLPHFGRAFLRHSIVDVVILIRRRKSRRKGPEREREREFGRIVRRPSSSSSSLFIIAREEEEEHIFEFAVKNLWVPPSVAST
jgi:hypothetical protein